MTTTVFLLSLMGAMALGMPIAIALLVCGIAVMMQMGIFDSQILAQKLIDGADTFPLMAVPYFLLAGELMNVGGLSKKIVAAATAMVGHIRGGLGYVVIGTGLVLASLSGSAIADTATLAVMLIPLIREAGYNLKRSCGLIAATGIIAPCIPPSVGFVLFGVTANVSILKLFVAGVVPGILMALSLVVVWWWIARNDDIVLPRRKSIREVLVALRGALWAMGMPFIVIGGLKFGFFTPTESAIVATAYTLVVSLVVYRDLSFRAFYQAALGAAETSAVIMFMVAAAQVSSWLLTVADIPDELVRMVEPFMDNKMLLMALLMVVVYLVGTALDFTPSILILTPVMMPVVRAAGIDPVYFGVLFIMNNAIGMITPPVGVVLNVVCGVAKIRMEDAIRGVIPFLIAETGVLALLVLFPALVIVPAKWFS
jgi:tripartite ATP-independent transporter DctM subunit